MEKYDKLFINGKIYTVDKNKSWAEAIAVSGNRISFVGTDYEAEAIKKDSKEIVDLKGRMVLPGFIDGHMHIYLAGPERLFKIMLHGLETEDDYLKEIKRYIDMHPDMEKYEGCGWINPAFGPKGPTRHSLDSICPDKPLVLDSGDHHSFWANTKAIEYCGITSETTVPEGNVIEREEDGYPSGVFREFAAIKLLDKARLKFTKEDFKSVIRDMQKFYGAYGVTTLFDAMVPADSLIVDAYRELAEEGELTCRIRGAFESSEHLSSEQVENFIASRRKISGYKEKLKIEQVKVFIDGVIEGKTGYLKKPYNDEVDYCGNPIWNQEALSNMCIRADKEGFDLHFHVIGDAAIEMMVNCLDKVRDTNPDNDKRRPVATHLQIVDEGDIVRMAKNNIVCLSNPYWFFKEKGYYDGIEVPYLGERAEHEYPMKSLFDAGMTVGMGSDYSVTPDPNPLKGIQIAVTRLKEDAKSNTCNESDVLWPDERVSLEQMIEAATFGNAYSNHDEDIIGTLEVGKLADFVVLEDNVFDVPVDEIHNIKVCMTIFDGEVVFKE